MMVVVHVASAYQVYMQPVYQIIEKGIMHRTGKDRVNPWLGTGLRLGFVAFITLVAIIIPFFSNLMVSVYSIPRLRLLHYLSMYPLIHHHD